MIEIFCFLNICGCVWDDYGCSKDSFATERQRERDDMTVLYVRVCVAHAHAHAIFIHSDTVCHT